jgi:hypothetical protein
MVIQTLSQPGGGQSLTRRSEGDDVHRLDVGTVYLADVTEVLHVGEATSGDCDGIGLDLSSPHWLNAA